MAMHGNNHGQAMAITMAINYWPYLAMLMPMLAMLMATLAIIMAMPWQLFIGNTNGHACQCYLPCMAMTMAIPGHNTGNTNGHAWQ